MERTEALRNMSTRRIEMPGQGRPYRPRSDDVGSATWLPVACRLIAAALCALTCLSGVRATAADVQVRIAWGGGEARMWSGRVRVVNGQILARRALGLSPDSPGSLTTGRGRRRHRDLPALASILRWHRLAGSRHARDAGGSRADGPRPEHAAAATTGSVAPRAGAGLSQPAAGQGGESTVDSAASRRLAAAGSGPNGR